MKGKLKILETNQKSEEITQFFPIFCVLRDTVIAMLFRRNVQVGLGCTKTQSPKISTVLYYPPPDVHIFHTKPSLFNK